MLIQLIVSMFGIAFVHRNLSLLGKFNVISSSKLSSVFYFLQLPFYLYLIFKELLPAILIYIGIISVTLILFEKIIGYFRQKTFDSIHLHVIESLILHLKSGKSAQTSVKNVFENFSAWEKGVFCGLTEILEMKSAKKYENEQQNEFQTHYFCELALILRSSSGVTDQLAAFRKALRLYNGLQRRSKQAVQATKAQALVSAIIYVMLIFLSIRYLDFKFYSLPMLVSAAFFVAGQLIIFGLGGKIRWKT